MLIVGVRIVGREASATEPVDVRLDSGRITACGRLRPEPDEQVVDAQGRWAIPGLWDRHVHFDQWVAGRRRVDLSATTSAAHACQLIGEEVAGQRGGSDRLLVGYGHRLSRWADEPRLADLDAVTGGRPVVLISGDAHNGWLNTAAAKLLGLAPPETVLTEHVWFPVMSQVANLERTRAGFEDDVDSAIGDIVARGVVGLTDMEFERAWQHWGDRAARGVPALRVEASVYPDYLAEVLELGLRSGQSLGGLVTMGPLKIISDGSLGTLTAHCSRPYLQPDGKAPNSGVQTVPPAELVRLLGLAARNGLDVALHAIGDAACRTALDAVEATGALTSIEHAQLIDPDQIVRMARLGVRASVQPAHLLDDAAVMDRVWADRTADAFPLHAMLAAGVELSLGSDAPVSVLDPWLQMDAAVRRPASWAPGAPSWHPEQAITPGEALFAATHGQPPLAPGGPADMVLLDADPLTTALDQMACAASIIAGQLRHDGR